MRFIISTVAALGLCCGAAFADEKVTDDEAAKLKELVAGWGCEGGTFEKETESTGMYEANDVKCKTTNYDFKVDKAFKVVAITID